MKIIAWTIFSYECNHLHFRRRTSLLCRIERILNKFSTSLRSDLTTITIIIVIDAIVILLSLLFILFLTILNINITLIKARDENLYFVIALVLIYYQTFINKIMRNNTRERQINLLFFLKLLFYL